MSAATHGAGAGAVLGVVFVLLGQQFGYYGLSGLVTAVLYIGAGLVVGAVLFGAIGAGLGRLYLRRHPPPPK